MAQAPSTEGGLLTRTWLSDLFGVFPVGVSKESVVVLFFFSFFDAEGKTASGEGKGAVNWSLPANVGVQRGRESN